MSRIEIPFSEACERNKEPILSVVGGYFDGASSVLEIGTGTAQHALYFARANPHLVWQTSDQHVYLSGIEAQLSLASVGNVAQPIELNVRQAQWLNDERKFDLVYTANTLHIMSENDVLAFFDGLPSVFSESGVLVVYGPFKYGGEFTSDSNAAFDQSLRMRGVGSGIRDFEWINSLALKSGLNLLADYPMPANNQCLVWGVGDG